MNAVSNIYESLFKGCIFLRHDLLQDRKIIYSFFFFLFYILQPLHGKIAYYIQDDREGF